MLGASVQPPDQEVEGGAGSAASGWTPLGRSALGVRAAAGAADEGREAEPRWAARLPVGCACGRGGGREAARAAGAEVGAAAAGEAASPPGDAASEGTRVDATPPSGFSKPSTRKGLASSQLCLLGRRSRRQTFGLESGKIPGGRAGCAAPGPPKFTLAGERGVCRVEVGGPRRPLPTGVCPAFSNASELELFVFCGVGKYFPDRNA